MIARISIAIALAALALQVAHAQTNVTVSESTEITLLRDTATFATLNSWEQCRQCADDLARGRVSTIAACPKPVTLPTSGSMTYTCQTEKRKLVATYTPASVPLAAPVVTLTSPAANTIAASWAAVPEATSYRYEQCFTAGCTPTALASTLTVTSVRYSISAGVTTYRNRVCALADTRSTCSQINTVSVLQSTATQSGPGQASLSWRAPTQNTDGTPLTDLAGYRIYYGTSADSLWNEVDVPNPAATTYTVTGLPSGPHFFALRAISSLGAQSDLSNIVTKTIV